MRFFLFLVFISSVFAGSTSSDLLTFQVTAVNEVAFDGDEPLIFIDAADNGDILPGSDFSSTYGVLCNEVTTKRVSASITPMFPEGMTLQLVLENVDGVLTPPTLLTDGAVEVLSFSGPASKTDMQVNLIVEADYSVDPDTYLTTMTFTLSD